MNVGVAASIVWKILRILGIDDRVRGLLERPTFDIPEGKAIKKRFGSEGYRYDIEFKNTGREVAKNCQVAVWLVGVHPEDRLFIRLHRPLGWLDVDSDADIDPVGLPKTVNLHPDDTRSVYLGGTSSVQNTFIFPEAENKSQYVYKVDIDRRESYLDSLRDPTYTPAHNFDEFSDEEKSRQINFRYLREIDWEYLHLKITAANAPSKFYRINIKQDGVGARPDFIFNEIDKELKRV